MARRRRFWMLAVGLAAAVELSAAQAVTQKEASLVAQKVDAITQRGAAPRTGKPSKPVRTVLSERELNIYLQTGGKDQFPAGVRDAQLAIVSEQRVSGRAIVDLDAVRKAKERSWLDPASYLAGALEVKVTGTLQTADGKGTFVLESATVGGVPVPKSLVQELITYYSRTPETPDGFSLDRPFDLPSNIREVQLQRGAVTVIQ